MPNTYEICKIVLPNGDICNIKDTKYEPATSSAAGLLSSIDKTKLDALVEIPSINASDNGKILRVVNGIWTATMP